MSDYRDKLLQMIKTLAYQEGDFILASGQQSNYFIDMSKITLIPEGRRLVLKCLQDLTTNLTYHIIGGPVLGAVPMVMDLSGFSNTRVFFNRAMPDKKGRMIEGLINIGEKALILEDVVTTGGSVINGVYYVREAGGQVNDVITIVDRLQGGRQALKNINIELYSIFTINDIKS